MYNFSNFCSDLEKIIDNSDSYQTVINRGADIMRQLLNNKDLIHSDQIEAIHNGDLDHNVYKSDKNKFIVQIFTWSPGSETPIHDHDNTWALMGIYQNGLRVAEFSFNNNDLKETQNYFANEGGVCYLIPPEEIHHVSNPTDELSVSIHVYGKNIDEYNIYDLENGKVIHQVV